MASHRQSYKAGETEGRAREKGEQMKEDMKNKSEAAKQKTFETAEQVKNKAEAGKERTKDAAHSAGGENVAEDRERNSAGILQQTGDKMKNMAHGATDAVKRTFGVGDADDETEDVNHGSRTTGINH